MLKQRVGSQMTTCGMINDYGFASNGLHVTLSQQLLSLRVLLRYNVE